MISKRRPSLSLGSHPSKRSILDPSVRFDLAGPIARFPDSRGSLTRAGWRAPNFQFQNPIQN